MCSDINLLNRYCKSAPSKDKTGFQTGSSCSSKMLIKIQRHMTATSLYGSSNAVHALGPRDLCSIQKRKELLFSRDLVYMCNKVASCSLSQIQL